METTRRPNLPVCLGQTVITANALANLANEDVLKAIRRHQSGDWGDLDSFDKKANDDALQIGARLFSAYHTPAGRKFWIITEADRSITTVLLPEDY